MNFVPRPLRIAVIGSGITGLSAAWLLATRHRVTLYESGPRLGGHSNTLTVDLGGMRTPVDTGFIVYNEDTYPNLVAMFDHLGVPTKHSDMSFAVSLDGGGLEYCGSGLGGVFAQRRNVLRPRFWSMLSSLVRFYRVARAQTQDIGEITLDEYLDRGGYSHAFRELHLYPMAAAIWSTPAGRVGDYPAAAFIRFCQNHKLLELGDRPQWRTVDGGSRVYVEMLARLIGEDVRLATPVREIRRGEDGGVTVFDGLGGSDTFDHVVLATHADQSLAMLGDADAEEERVLGAFKYSKNLAVLHTDQRLMPMRRSVWSSWNYIADGGADKRPPSITYWMNRLQGLPLREDVFVSLNSVRAPRDEAIIREIPYEHPLFDSRALAAQPQVWSLQGRRNTWFCGAWMGAGFHEDGLQSGLAVAEALGGVRRPWLVPGESSRVFVGPPPVVAGAELA